MQKTLSFVTLVSLLLIASVSSAAIAFDPATGTGFIGKGDVQTAFSWNNKTLQNNAEDVSFSYTETQTRYKDCLQNGNPHSDPIRLDDARTQTRNIGADVSYESRKNSKGAQGPVTGFLLTGYVGEPHNQGGITNINCPSGYHPANGDEQTGWSNWETTGDPLFSVNWGNSSYPLN